MANNTDKIFRIIVDSQTGMQNLSNINKQLEKVLQAEKKLAEERKKLDKSLQNGNISEQQYTKAINANTVAAEKNRREVIAINEQRRKAASEVKRLITAEAAQKGSIDEMRNRLTTLRMQYRELSAEQRRNKHLLLHPRLAI